MKPCLCIMAKNEAAVIRRALDSVRAAIGGVALLLDSTTTDNTKEVVREFCKENDLGFTWQANFWDNFGASRNRALDLGRQIGAEFLLMLDADDWFDNAEFFLSVSKDYDAYEFPIRHGSLNYRKVQIVRASKPFYFDMPTHEGLYCKEEFKTLCIPEIIMNIGHGSARPNEKEAFERDAALLEAYLREYPDNLRALFYLAQSYRDAGDLWMASAYYLKRAQSGGWVEEAYIAYVEFAKCLERLNKEPPEVAAAYFAAYVKRPERGEAPSHLVRYLKGLGWVCEGLETLIPESPPVLDVLFVEPACYHSRTY